jgi:hypothetical protein
MPEECGGVQGQAIFIDTEGSFNVSRLEGSVHIILLLIILFLLNFYNQSVKDLFYMRFCF